MRFLRRIASVLGFVKDEHHDHGGVQEDAEENTPRHVPTKGFSFQVPVRVERPQLGPLLVPSSIGGGGVQGLGWYAKRLRIDEDGDVADAFLNEVHPVASNSDNNQRIPPKFEVKHGTRPAKIRNQVISLDGNIHHSVEFKGRVLRV